MPDQICSDMMECVTLAVTEYVQGVIALCQFHGGRLCNADEH